ncbi:MAG: hypothetical protein AAF533_17090 [Acidobacteriota bacterium]
MDGVHSKTGSWCACWLLVLALVGPARASTNPEDARFLPWTPGWQVGDSWVLERPERRWKRDGEQVLFRFLVRRCEPELEGTRHDGCLAIEVVGGRRTEGGDLPSFAARKGGWVHRFNTKGGSSLLRELGRPEGPRYRHLVGSLFFRSTGQPGRLGVSEYRPPWQPVENQVELLNDGVRYHGSKGTADYYQGQPWPVEVVRDETSGDFVAVEQVVARRRFTADELARERMAIGSHELRPLIEEAKPCAWRSTWRPGLYWVLRRPFGPHSEGLRTDWHEHAPSNPSKPEGWTEWRFELRDIDLDLAGGDCEGDLLELRVLTRHRTADEDEPIPFEEARRQRALLCGRDGRWLGSDEWEHDAGEWRASDPFRRLGGVHWRALRPSWYPTIPYVALPPLRRLGAGGAWMLDSHWTQPSHAKSSALPGGQAPTLATRLPSGEGIRVDHGLRRSSHRTRLVYLFRHGQPWPVVVRESLDRSGELVRTELTEIVEVGELATTRAPSLPSTPRTRRQPMGSGD